MVLSVRYLAIGMIPQCLVSLVNHHTLDVQRGAGGSRQVVHQHLGSEEEDAPGPPQFLPMLSLRAPWWKRNGNVRQDMFYGLAMALLKHV